MKETNNFLKLPKETQAAFESLKKVGKPWADILQNLQPNTEAFKKLSLTITKFANDFDKMSENDRRIILIFGEIGWFLDKDLFTSYYWIIKNGLNEENKEEIENELIAHFRKKINDIEKNIKKNYPHRTKIISAVFKAHKRGEYELSVPVLLTQIDGMCNESLSQSLFLTNNGKLATDESLSKESEKIYAFGFFAVFRNILPIQKGKKERDKTIDFCELNRHVVLHGLATDYATEKNSLKLISLINYINQTLEFIKEIRKKELDKNL